MTEHENGTLLREILENGFGGEGDLRTLRDSLAARDALSLGDWEDVLRDGKLSCEVLRLGRAMAELYAPWVWAALLNETKEGSIPAMKLYFELCKARESDGAGVGIDGGLQALRQAIFSGSRGEAGGAGGVSAHG